MLNTIKKISETYTNKEEFLSEKVFKTLKLAHPIKTKDFEDFDEYIDFHVFKLSYNDLKEMEEDNIKLIVNEKQYENLSKKQDLIIKQNNEKLDKLSKHLPKGYEIINNVDNIKVFVTNSKTNEIEEKIISRPQEVYPTCKLKHENCGHVAVYWDIRKSLMNMSKSGLCNYCRARKILK